MDINVARHVLRTAFRCSRELELTLPLLKITCTPSEYEAHGKGVASAMAEIGLKVVNAVLAEHPALEAEVESQVARYGRYL